MMEESRSDLKIREFVDNLCRLLVGTEYHGFEDCPSIVRVNNEDLTKRGEFSFMSNIEPWRKAFRNSFASELPSANNIIEYYLLRNGVELFRENEYETKDENDGEEKSVAMRKAFQSIVKASENFGLEIERCTLRKERVCIFLNRKKTLVDCLSHILARDSDYGKLRPENKRSFYFRIVNDDDSQLTNLRLRLIEGVAKNIVRTHGYEINQSDDSDGYDITTKSRIDSETRPKVLLCGVAKSSATGTKETDVTEIDYFQRKLAELADTTEHKLPLSEQSSKEKNSILVRIAEAAVALEFLSVKPGRVLTIASNLDSDKSKGSSFILYNTARISAIFQKFHEQNSKGNYPDLPDIEEVNFSLLIEEEEWELFYHFLLGYPEMVKSCVRLDNDLEICPQYICSFLSRLCGKFSAYYRRVRILTEGRDHLLPTMIARLYLLKAIQIVTCNALRLLNIDPVSRM